MDFLFSWKPWIQIAAPGRPCGHVANSGNDAIELTSHALSLDRGPRWSSCRRLLSLSTVIPAMIVRQDHDDLGHVVSRRGDGSRLECNDNFLCGRNPRTYRTISAHPLLSGGESPRACQRSTHTHLNSGSDLDHAS